MYSHCLLLTPLLLTLLLLSRVVETHYIVMHLLDRCVCRHMQHAFTACQPFMPHLTFGAILRNACSSHLHELVKIWQRIVK